VLRRVLLEKVNALTIDVKEYKDAHADAGIAFMEEEVDMDED
jgi:hypothetical protein